jgi:cystathionine gamma-synthase
MGAISTVITALLKPGDLLLAPHDCYGGSWRLFDALARKGNFELRLVNLSAPDAASIIAEAKPTVLWIETPSNPLLRVSDIAALSAAGHAAGAIVVADNTFLSPIFQRPLELGADLVVHSTTKYLNGHSDVVGGVIVAATAELHTDLLWWANCLGVTGGAFDAYLAMRGLRTLHLRMAAHEANAARVVELLSGHPAVSRVHYPGLESHPGHLIASRQQSGFGGIVTFELHGAETQVRAFFDAITLFCPAESLGGVESLVSHPATMTHASMPPQVQEAAGITPTMLRLSIGIEEAGDLVADLTQALDRASGG